MELLVIIIILVLIFDYINGFYDVVNLIVIIVLIKVFILF